jgi:p-hydroxybenzoate 3-monooxygenase
VAGCDGERGVSRGYIPDGILTAYSFDHGIGWLAIAANSPAPRYPLFAISRHGFAAHFGRGSRASRFYLQCDPRETPDHWPGDRIWQQLRLRLDDGNLPDSPISDATAVDMTSTVYEPMCYGRLYLVGDAAHLITPVGGKGMNLALHDADVLARALRSAVNDGDEGPLNAYSATCLRRVWDCQEFSRWTLEMLHDAGDDSTVGPFRGKLARARLERLFTSDTAGRFFAEFMT